MTQQKEFNEAAIERFRELGGDEFVLKMLDLVLKNASRRIEEARDAHQAGDFDAIAQAAHALRSSVGNIEALRLMELSQKIETLAKEKKGGELPALFAELDRRFEQLKNEMALERSKLGS